MALFYPHYMTFTSLWVLLQALRNAHVDKTSGGSRESLAAVFVRTGTGASWSENSDVTGEYRGKKMLLDLPKDDKNKMCTYVVMLRICFYRFQSRTCWILPLLYFTLDNVDFNLPTHVRSSPEKANKTADFSNQNKQWKKFGSRSATSGFV